MKVYYIGSEFMGCYYVRCFLPMLANGWRGTHAGLTLQSRKDPKVVAQEMLNSDIVVFHRANKPEHHKLGMLARSAGKKIVFDNDDTFQMDSTNIFSKLDERGMPENKEKLNNIVYSFICNSDLVTASTPALADEYRDVLKKYGHDVPVVVLPNYMNPSDWPKPLRNEGNKVRIGLVGSTAYHEDFQGIKDVLVKLDKDPRIQLVLFGLWKDKRKSNPLVESVHKDEYAFWDTLENLEHVEWAEMSDYFRTLNKLRLDIMLIPRKNNHLNRCKSNIKYLEASMLEIPVIAQGFVGGPYEDLEGWNGVLVRDNSKWEEEIMKLVESCDLRREIGENAHKYVLDNYNIHDHAHKWREAYQTLTS